MRKISETASRMKAIVSEKSNRIKSLDEKISILKSEMDEHMRELRNHIEPLSLSEAVSCISKFKPEIISVGDEKNNFVILRPYGTKEFGILFWASKKTSTMWQVSFNCNGFTSMAYSVVCACCNSELRDYEEPRAESKKLEEWKTEMKKRFSDAVAGTCKKHGIKTLFMRNASSWNEHYGDDSISVVELDKYKDVIERRYGSNAVEKGLSFIARITN